jgi:hypothetical protein
MRLTAFPPFTRNYRMRAGQDLRRLSVRLTPPSWFKAEVEG